MKTKIYLMIIAVSMLFAVNVYADELMSQRVVSVNPVNDSYAVDAVNCEMDITYADTVIAAEKTVLVNNSAGYVDEVTADESVLKIKFKNLQAGERYKVSVTGTEGVDVVSFFTTRPSGINIIESFQSGNFDDFYDSVVSWASAVLSPTEFSFETTRTNRQTGARVTSQEFDISAADVKKIIIGCETDNAVTLNLKFNKTGETRFGHMFSENLTAGQNEIVITTSNNTDWSDTIKEFMLEQSQPILNEIRISYIRFENETTSGMLLGKLNIYENYMQQNEVIATSTAISEQTVTAVLETAAAGTESGKILLVAAHYNNGRMVNAKCKLISIAANTVIPPQALELETGGTGYVKAFLRRGIKDIRELDNVSTVIQ